MLLYKENLVKHTKMPFVFFTEEKDVMYGLNGRKNSISIFKNDVEHIVQVKRPFKKLTIDRENNQFLAILSTKINSDYIYKLDFELNEFDHFSIQQGSSSFMIEDIWYDNYLGLIYILSNNHIEKYNTNGDCLGRFLSCNTEKTLKALCSFEDIIFIAYEKNNSAYISKYTNKGAVLSNLHLGNDFTIHNLFISKKDTGKYLKVFGVKKCSYQYFIEVDFNEDTHSHKNNDLEINCICSDKNIISTCYVRRKPQ